MKTTIFTSAMLLPISLLAFDSTICFTENVPTKEGDAFFADSEVYISRSMLPEDYAIKIATNGEVVKGPTSCRVEPSVIGYGTHLVCGTDRVSLDFSNNSGFITRYSEEFKSHGDQKLVCRDRKVLIH